MNVPDLKIFAATRIDVGIFHFFTIHEYWRTDGVASLCPCEIYA